MVVTKVELSNISVQMLLPAMLINAFHATLEDAENALQRVHMHVATTVLTNGMVDHFVGGGSKIAAPIITRSVGHQLAFMMNVLADDAFDIGTTYAVDDRGAGRTAALNEFTTTILCPTPGCFGKPFLFT